MEYIFLDTETTGFGPCRMVELAYWKGHKFTSFRVKPPIPIEFEASAVNHISNKMVADLEPFQGSSKYLKTKKEIESGILVAHEAIFDIGVLEREGLDIVDYICTKEMAKAAFPNEKSHKLQVLRYSLDLDVEGVAHSAGGDVNVMMALWDRMLKEGIDPQKFIRNR